jgi:hypothetical protein
MRIEDKELKPARVEVVRKTYNEQNQVVVEQVEYYYPEDVECVIGFKLKKKYAKKNK